MGMAVGWAQLHFVLRLSAIAQWHGARMRRNGRTNERRTWRRLPRYGMPVLRSSGVASGYRVAPG